MSESVKQQLIEQRKKLKIKQKYVADYIGITQAALSRFENGKTELKIDHAEKYAKALGLELRLLIKN